MPDNPYAVWVVSSGHYRRLRLAAMWGSQSWLQPAFSRLAPADALAFCRKTAIVPHLP